MVRIMKGRISVRINGISLLFVGFFFALAIVVSFKTSHAQELPLSMIQGRWSYVDNKDSYNEYLPTGELHVVTKIAGTYYSNLDDGPIFYRLEERNDTLFLIHKYKQRMVDNENILGFEERLAIQIRGDYMEYVCLKTRKGINQHIDEYGVRIRHLKQEPHHCDVGMPYTIYILPANFSGHVTIAYAHPDGSAPEYDVHGNRVVHIPPSGLLKTQMKEDAFGTAGGRYRVLIPDATNQSLIQLPSVDKFYISTCELDPHTVGVLMQGFNQLAREDVNKLFGECIVGNTMMFFVGSFEKGATQIIGKAWF